MARLIKQDQTDITNKGSDAALKISLGRESDENQANLEGVIFKFNK